MKLSRKAKRYDDSVLAGDFQGFEPFLDADPSLEGAVVSGALRRLGCLVEVEHLEVERAQPRKQSFAKLRSRAETFSRQVTYLKERLEIVDHDRRGMFIQLRSLPPSKDDHQIEFNEVCIGRDRVVVKRIAFSRKDEVKRQVPLSLGEDDLRRLLSDIRQVFALA